MMMSMKYNGIQLLLIFRHQPNMISSCASSMCSWTTLIEDPGPDSPEFLLIHLTVELLHVFLWRYISIFIHFVTDTVCKCVSVCKCVNEWNCPCNCLCIKLCPCKHSCNLQVVTSGQWVTDVSVTGKVPPSNYSLPVTYNGVSAEQINALTKVSDFCWQVCLYPFTFVNCVQFSNMGCWLAVWIFTK